MNPSASRSPWPTDKALYVVTSAVFGGASRHVIALASSHVSAEAHDMTVLAGGA
jgi:hypothetical protein